MVHRRSDRFGYVSVLTVAALLFASCGDEGPAPDLGEAPPPVEDVGTASPPADTPATVAPPRVETDAEPTTGSTSDSGTEIVTAPARSAQVALDQPAIWPAPDVVFTTPEEAAADFVSEVLISEGDPELGAFQQGDARSGEIAVLFAGETGDLDPPQEKGLLLLRQIGPTDGWYVIAATSDGVVIDTPAALDSVPLGTVTVSGQGRGFEGTLGVSAFAPGDLGARLDFEIGAGGAMADLEPYSVELDLSAAAEGDVVVILVHGDTGLGNDPSTFAAIPIVMAAAPPGTIPPTK